MSSESESVEIGPAFETDPALQGRPLTLGGFLRAVTERDPEHEAIVTPRQRFTYRQLHDRAVDVARALIAAGSGKATKVALLLPNGPEWVAGFFGSALIGAVAVTVNALAGDEDLEYMLRRSDAEFLLTDSSMLAKLERGDLLNRHPLLRPGATVPRDTGLPAFRATLQVDAAEFASPGRDVPMELIDALAAEVTAEDDALIMFTSGSTGRPKAVLHMHRAICVQSWRWPRLVELTSTDRLWSTSPFFWSSGLTRTLGATLAAGATLVLQEHFEPGQALEMLAKERVTAMLSRAHLDNRLITEPDFDRHDLSALRRLEDRSPLRQRLPHAEVWRASGYGMTETMTLISSTGLLRPGELAGAASGPPLVGMTVKVVDPATGTVVPRGTPGRICVRGLTLMRGYYKVPRSEVFDDDGFFSTSDAGFLDEDGQVHWTGRLDDMAKVAGVNVFPIEIERRLASWGRLAAYSVVSLPHPSLGAALVLCAVPPDPHEDGNDVVDERAIDEYLRSHLAGYQVPRRILLFGGDELSYTATQKLDLKAVRRLAIDRLVSEGVDAEWTEHLHRLRDSDELRPERGATAT